MGTSMFAITFQPSGISPTAARHFEQYDYLVGQMAVDHQAGRSLRFTVPMCLTTPAACGTSPHEIIRIHEKYGFQYPRNRINSGKSLWVLCARWSKA